MSASERIMRALDSLKLPLSLSGDCIYDAAGGLVAKINKDRTKYPSDAIRDSQAICDIVNNASELLKEMESR